MGFPTRNIRHSPFPGIFIDLLFFLRLLPAYKVLGEMEGTPLDAEGQGWGLTTALPFPPCHSTLMPGQFITEGAWNLNKTGLARHVCIPNVQWNPAQEYPLAHL